MDGSVLNRRHCLNHPEREPVARCPVCLMFFCRECVVEHEDRLLCSGCLRRKTAEAVGAKQGRFRVGLFLRAAFSFLVLWILFFLLGEGLLRLPDAWHDGAPRDRKAQE